MSMSNTKTLGYLPNLCVPALLLRTLMATELFAFVLALGVSQSFQDFLGALGLHSIFILWVALASVLSICIGRLPCASPP